MYILFSGAYKYACHIHMCLVNSWRFSLVWLGSYSCLSRICKIELKYILLFFFSSAAPSPVCCWPNCFYCFCMCCWRKDLRSRSIIAGSNQFTPSVSPSWFCVLRTEQNCGWGAPGSRQCGDKRRGAGLQMDPKLCYIQAHYSYKLQ